MFTNFSHQVYKNTLLIQDFYHFQKQHDQQLYHIAKYASDIGKSCGACDVDSCDYTSRHYRVQNICITKDDMDPNIRFYASTLDSFYFYPSHLHHVELRCIEREEDLIEDDDTKDDSYDPEFARIHDIISSTREASNRFNRVSPESKFNHGTDESIQTEEELNE